MDEFLFPQDQVVSGDKFRRTGGAKLRDMIAIAAMRKVTLFSDPEDFARECYKIADAFLKAGNE